MSDPEHFASQEIDKNSLINKVLLDYDINENYPGKKFIEGKLRGLFIPDLIKSYGSLAEVKGKRILDIGCGSLDYDSSRQYEPWFCRLALELGADVVGVDRGFLDGERFTHYQLDIRDPAALSIFAEHSFDGIHVRNVFDSSPDMRLERSDRLQLEERLLGESGRLLSETGKVIFPDKLYYEMLNIVVPPGLAVQ